DLSASDVKSATSIATTTRKYAAEHPEIVEHYLRAIIRGIHRAYVDKPATAAALMKYGGISDPAVASQTYDYFVNGALWVKDGMPTMEGLQQNLDAAAAENVEG